MVMMKYKKPKLEDFVDPLALAYRDTIQDAKDKVNEAEQYLANVIRKCKHVLWPLDEKQREALREGDLDWSDSSAYCLICNRRFGWRCPDSPDTACHYYTEDGKVELIDGTLIDPPADHDVEYETDDDCIFCGAPDERK